MYVHLAGLSTSSPVKDTAAFLARKPLNSGRTSRGTEGRSMGIQEGSAALCVPTRLAGSMTWRDI